MFFYIYIPNGAITDLMWTTTPEVFHYLQTANEFKCYRTVQMVLILGNSCEVIPLETNSLMSFLRRRPPLSCLQPRTVSYIVSEFLGNNFLLCMWYSHLDFYLETLYPVPYFSFFSIAQEPHFSQYICCHFCISCKFKCIADSHLLLNLTVHNISFVVFKHD